MIVTLPVNGPPAVVRMKNRHFRLHRCPGKCRPSFIKLPPNLLGFAVERNRGAISAYQRPVILLLAVERAAPLPVAHSVGAMSNCVPCHRPHFALVERVVHSSPVDGTGLSFHHPEILALESASEVMRRAVCRGIKMSLPDVIVP